MPRKKPLSKSRLHEILELFDDGIEIEMKGGSDTGAYFSFKGRANRSIDPADRIVGGRIVTAWGFCSEAIMPTRRESFLRGGTEAFFRRCDERLARFRRWTDEFYGPSVPKP